jgi:peptide/nickel transport system permease protein
MLHYVARRLAFSIPVLLLVSVFVYYVLTSTGSFPPDPALAKVLGLDRQGIFRYTAWLSHFVRGDWGRSIYTNVPVLPGITRALANSFVLGAVSVCLSLVLGIWVGTYSALHQYSGFDHFTSGAAFVLISMPVFVSALLLQQTFGVVLPRLLNTGRELLPVAGLYTPGRVGFDLLDRIRHMVLPVVVLSSQWIAVISRYMRASMLDVIDSDFIRTARAKGLASMRVSFHHAMPNALIPVVTQLAIEIGAIAGGFIIVESVFQYPGMGYYFIRAMSARDWTQALPWTMVTVAFVITFNLLADVVYAALDPRIRYR